MRGFEEIVPCTQFFQSKDLQEVEEWTRGAREACTEFRQMLQRFINGQRPLHEGATGQECYERGRSAFMKGLNGLL